jgi:K(+)-stimulated pyrophosphate-energized sodium pump
VSLVAAFVAAFVPRIAHAAEPHKGGEANLILPDLSTVQVLGTDGHTLLMFGLVVSALGVLFGVVTLKQIKNLPVHKSMADVSQIIWESSS